MNTLTTSERDVSSLFLDALDAVLPGQMTDFLRKVSLELTNFDPPVVEWLAYAVSERARAYFNPPSHGLVDETFESVQAQKLIVDAVERVGDSDGRRLIEGAISRCSHDRLASTLVDLVEGKRWHRFSARISEGLPAIIEAFTHRMRTRYSVGSPDCVGDLSTSDWQAFRRWLEKSPEDQTIAHEFWAKFIGKSRKRLAEAINFIYPAGAVWSSDPRPILDAFFPANEFKSLIGKLEGNGELNDIEKDGIGRMGELLVGKYRSSP